MKFADIANPTEAELRQWATDPHASYPDEMSRDWDLIVADWSRIALIAELAVDRSSPTQGFFLGVLYLMAGDCVRNAAGSVNIPHLRALLERLERTTSEPLRLFRRRAVELLADPSKFDYYLWCDAGFLRGHGDTAGER
jgi:hypothetical protein